MKIAKRYQDSSVQSNDWILFYKILENEFHVLIFDQNESTLCSDRCKQKIECKFRIYHYFEINWLQPFRIYILFWNDYNMMILEYLELGKFWVYSNCNISLETKSCRILPLT